MVPIRVVYRPGMSLDENTIYVGRPSKWGSPFIIGEVYEGKKLTRTSSVNLFVLNRGFLKESEIQELRGKNLACWCSLNERCHADYLLAWANE